MTVIATPAEVAQTGDVLPMCPYHAQIDFYRAARDSFLESQGLVDLQQKVMRLQLVFYQKSVAIEEIVYREVMTM